MNKNIKTVFLFLLVFLVILATVYKGQDFAGKPDEISYSDFLNMVEPIEGKKPIGKITSKDGKETSAKQQIIIDRELIEGWYIPENSKDNKPKLFKTNVAQVNDDLVTKLRKSRLSFTAKSTEENKFWSVVSGIIPWLFALGIIWFIMMRQLQASGNKAFTFGKSRAKMNVDPKVKVTFNDVAGCEEAKVELLEIIEFLKDPKKFQAIGARIPKGVLLVGPPGTGKTLLAKAVAGEAGVPFFSISGSDFVEMFVGVGASRVRDLFDQGKKNAPCIIFIDEIDAVGRLRGAGLGGGHDEREQTLNQMLVEMDGFEMNEGVIVMAATNRADVLDPALLRPGRFDRQVIVDLPDLKGREEILAVHAKKVPLVSDISLNSIARGTPGFTGADLANLINEAALLAARRNKKRVTQEELEEARDKVMMGPERKSMFISDKEKEMTAYHEAGHALLGTLLPYTEPVHKVTIIPRGRALGLTQSLPVEDRHSYRKNYCLDRIVMSMGGYIAEELIFGDPSNGSSNDIQQATNIARRMVCEWGMSEKLGTIHYGSGETSPFMGRDYGHTSKPYSEEFAAMIDQEVKRIVQTCLDKGRDLVKKNQKKLDAIAKALLAKETIDAQELTDIVQPSFDKFSDSKSGLGSKKGKGSSTTKPAYSA
ncbi:ATP-dependent zinc metalloprotease FtsH [Leptospira bandrabouensis]|uniref:ATP-dependent zinc metalloprotease FtsH n=1 Tax=Leptospira bandrabouensis TaxID=2484903 RepID=A0A6H3NTN7_9LEPT|nr:ATP-dependent zinc metalloprotease FtsH [Leptospira bandrabouensis]MCG6143738.1 ATP-dependent zinc metalloprotease FtsH [Leptospira bandrabouensis]MCG6151222.1 ATP-dependent zinc metalloprotease FtsH [Leptospira bandrabouensis]MCG6159398.1 ATP-dependent zinc metalloprotease FtsH [Leptospira bandrabouensis]MCG6163332.1 ATP-dependent zinc metalloprotease FtsH [Leptospira bandrabouensis]MCW7457252.1 ATP-dependent zinc metalloprotease FtsH [Leptospira bandrabouensis]